MEILSCFGKRIILSLGILLVTCFFLASHSHALLLPSEGEAAEYPIGKPLHYFIFATMPVTNTLLIPFTLSKNTDEFEYTILLGASSIVDSLPSVLIGTLSTINPGLRSVTGVGGLVNIGGITTGSLIGFGIALLQSDLFFQPTFGAFIGALTGLILTPIVTHAMDIKSAGGIGLVGIGTYLSSYSCTVIGVPLIARVNRESDSPDKIFSSMFGVSPWVSTLAFKSVWYTGFIYRINHNGESILWTMAIGGGVGLLGGLLYGIPIQGYVPAMITSSIIGTVGGLISGYIDKSALLPLDDSYFTDPDIHDFTTLKLRDWRKHTYTTLIAIETFNYISHLIGYFVYWRIANPKDKPKHIVKNKYSKLPAWSLTMAPITMKTPSGTNVDSGVQLNMSFRF